MVLRTQELRAVLQTHSEMKYSEFEAQCLFLLGGIHQTNTVNMPGALVQLKPSCWGYFPPSSGANTDAIFLHTKLVGLRRASK